MDPTLVEVLVRIGAPLLLLVGAYFAGSWLERRHYREIRRREARWRRLPAVTLRRVPSGWRVRDSVLVTGSVVVSVDYFKRFLAGLRGLVGGRVKSYESILDRARREAVLRLKKEAMDRGFHAVINVRLETSRLASARRGGQGTAGLEVLAFGTALKLDRRPA
jgi:uncharacterized protein YbjQ (UPF0145 family)